MASEATLRMLLVGEDRSAGRVLRGVGKDADRTSGRLHSLSRMAGIALVAGFAAAGAAAVRFGRAAAEDEKSANILATALRNNAGATRDQVKATEDWISAQGRAFGVADDDLRPALASLVRATHDVGEAQKLASLAMDISAGTGKNLSTVSLALAKAQNGNVGALGRLGIATKDSAGKTKTLQQITEDLAKTYSGSAAKAADTTAGKQKRLTVQWNEAQEAIGYKLIPAMLALTEVATAALGWMEKHPKAVKAIAIAVGGLAVALAALIVLEKAHAAAMALQAAGGLVAWLKATKAVTAAQWLMNAALTANPIGVVIVAIAALVAGLVIAYKKSETFRAIVNGAFKAIGIAAKAMWEYYIRPVLKFWLNLWFTVVGALLSGAAKAFGWVPGIGKKLKAASEKFYEFRDRVNGALDGIHKNPTVTVHMKLDASSYVAGINSLPLMPNGSGSRSGASNAVGTVSWAGGWTRIDELGKEYVNLPRGSQILSASRSQQMMTAGTTGAVSGNTLVFNLNGVGFDKRHAAREIIGILKEAGVTTGTVVTT